MSEAEPEGWSRVRLHQLFQERKERGSNGLPIASVSIESGLVLRSTLDRRVDSALADEAHALVRKDDIAYNMMRMWQGACGLAKHDCLVSPAYVVMTPSHEIHPEFAFAMLKSRAMIKLLHAYSQGVVDDRLRLYPDAFGQIPANIPPLGEQRRIAEVLRSVDAAMAANAAVIAACKQTVASLSQRVAKPTGEIIRIESFGRIVTGRTPSPQKEELWGGALPFVTPGDLEDGAISVVGAARHLNAQAPHGAKILPAGSVLVTCIGSTIGKTAIARTSCATNQQINAVCCEPRISGYVYLACVAAYDDLVANAGRQAVPIINKGTFSRVEVPRHSMEEMIEVSAVVDALDAQLRSSGAALEKLDRLKAQVADDLLSGRVRVPA